METVEKIKTSRKMDATDDTYVSSVEVTTKTVPTYGMGWLPDLPDFRDYSIQNEEVKKIFKGTKIAKTAAPSLPASIDLRQWCSPIEDQGSLGSCTANAGAALLEYFERRAFGTHLDASRLFLYKATRNFCQFTGDTGAFLRTTMGAMVLFGVPPEKYWPYIISKFDVEPSAFLYSFGANYKALKYYRLDPINSSPENTLKNIKTTLAGGLPSMFGFTVYSSFYQAEATGKIPFPALKGDTQEGGHAVVAVGYNDSIKIQNILPNCAPTKGALLIRNSWGKEWGGMGGYLWMPYDFVLKGVADDFWSLISADYVATGNFDI